MAEILSSLRPALDRFDGVILDIWGVLHDGGRPYPAAAAAVAGLASAGKRIVLVSNTPAEGAGILDVLARMGFAADLFAGIVTSGDAVRAALADPPGRRYALFSGDDGRYGGVEGLEIVPLDEADFILANSLMERDPRTDPDWRRILAPAAARRLPLVCANPDVVVMSGERIWYCAGALAELYESLGGPVLAYGKPHPPVYQSALALLGIERGRVIAIGDTPDTDILGARRQGLLSCLIAGGILAPRLLKSGAIDPAVLAGVEPQPDFVLPYLTL